MMAWPTIICGTLLSLIGVYGYLNATPNAEGEVSPTALIPAMIGGVLIVCGILAFQAKLRKHVMHLAAMFGLLGFFGGFMPIIRQLAKGNELNLTAPSAMSGLLMSGICAVFVFLCVKSFIDARKARQANESVAATRLT